MGGKAIFKTRKPQHVRTHPAGISDKVIRILDIYTYIAQKKFPSVETLCERFVVEKRTIYRYLEIINRIDSIEFDREKKGYKFTLGDRIKRLSLTDDELLLLLAMSESVSHLGEPLRNAFQGFVSDIANIKKVPLNQEKIPIVIKIPDAIGDESLNTYFKSIWTCINDKRSIDIVYKTLYSKETSERRVDPYGIVFYEGAWVLIGYCHRRDAMRSFALDRIAELKETNRYFRKRENFDLEEHLSRGWGIVCDKEDVKVKVRFSEEVAEHILRKKKWHPSEERAVLPSGEVELSFTVPGVEEIRRWIYSWIPNVEVVEPKWFRERLRKEFNEAAQRH